MQTAVNQQVIITRCVRSFR